ncbi:MAG: hypothetical protein EXS58_14100 [Candidatus Latescibacteria bacterium]|nr:hypothetical protein [Candidatus Latescibacterota bacterium]
MKTPKLQLEYALIRGELVTVCWEPTCSMHRLEKWGAQQWLPFAKSPAYRNYSHGICPDHVRLIQEEVEQFLFEQQLESLRHFQVEYQPVPGEPEPDLEFELIAA